MQTKEAKSIDLTYLNRCTKSKPALMIEMMSLYLAQTPPLITAMRQSLQNQDWALLKQAAHKMIPSFTIVGINPDFEKMARNVQVYAGTQQHIDELPAMVYQLETVCLQACKELEEEISNIKQTNQ